MGRGAITYKFIEFCETIGLLYLRFRTVNSIKILNVKSLKMQAGSYISTPEPLANKKAIVNIKNESISTHILSQHFNKKYFDEIVQPKDITYPINLYTAIKMFAELNNIKKKKKCTKRNGDYKSEYGINYII